MEKVAHNHQHTSPGKSLSAAFMWGVGLNLAYVVFEALAGWRLGSMALLSDAGHNFSDVLSLLLAMAAFGLSRMKPTKALTFGLGKSTVLISLFNALLLMAAMGAVAYEGGMRMIDPVPTDGGVIAWVAAAGIVVNGVSAWLFMAHQKEDLNARGAYLHLAADAAVSAGVVASGIASLYFNLPWLDGLASLLIAAVVVWSTWGLFRESLYLSLDGVPAGLKLDEVKALLEQAHGVVEAHHIHGWALSTTSAALTAHIVTSETTLEGAIRLKNDLKHRLAHAGIAHATLEMELAGEHCHDESHEILPAGGIDVHHNHRHG